MRAILDLSTPAEERPGLGHGFRVEAEITVWEGASVVSAPSGALFREGSEWATFVRRGARASGFSRTKTLKLDKDNLGISHHPHNRHRRPRSCESHNSLSHASTAECSPSPRHWPPEIETVP